MITRRDLIGALGTTLVAWPLALRAQQAPRIYRIGFVSPTSRGPTSDAFREGLKEAGYVEGQNVVIEARFAEGRNERMPELIAEVIRLKVDVLAIGSTNGALAAKKATSTLPIVFAGLVDPVATGVVASLARPGGNITGITFGIGGAGLAGKLVELLKEAIPKLSHVAALSNLASPYVATLVEEIQAAAGKLKVRLDVHDAANLAQVDKAFATISASPAQGLIVTNDPLFFTNRAKLIQFAAAKRMPAMYWTQEFVDAGGLMAYGSSVADSYRQAAKYVDKILKGAKPADLPIEQPTRFELAINLKTAKALGIIIPHTILLRADKVIE